MIYSRNSNSRLALNSTGVDKFDTMNNSNSDSWSFRKWLYSYFRNNQRSCQIITIFALVSCIFLYIINYESVFRITTPNYDIDGLSNKLDNHYINRIPVAYSVDRIYHKRQLTIVMNTFKREDFLKGKVS